ncbi:MAG TPA: M14 family zinc carboxypeptidase [Mobilitalea sp.]|nr:M14 family zinc carboxypeptidase [Mobilitalea sp.]
MIVDLEDAVYSYDKLIANGRAMAEKYHKIIHYVTIGSTHDNRDIVMLKLGYGRKYMLFCGGVHGRETINPIVLMHITEYYAELYTKHTVQKNYFNKQKPDVNLDMEEYEQIIFGNCIYELLSTFTILMIPLLNPDGYMVSLNGFDEIRDSTLKEKALGRNIISEEWKYNARGVDINRNFPCRLWRPKNPTDYVASENETKALIAVFNQYKVRGFIDFHSRGKSIYYYRRSMSASYNDRQLRVAKRLASIIKYELMPPSDELEPGDTGGNTVHYFSEHFNKLALTIETVDENAAFPLEHRYRSSTFEELKLVFFEFGSLII